MTPMNEDEARARLQGVTPGVRLEGFADDIIRTGRRRNARDRALVGVAAVAVLGAASAGVFLLNGGQTREAVPAQTRSAQPTPSSAAPTPSATPRPTPSATPSAPPSATPSGPAPERPTIQAQPGGGLVVDGASVGRAMGPGIDALSTDDFIARMGTPDEETTSEVCGRAEVTNTTYRWGDLAVIVLEEEDTENPYGFAYPPGEVAGWVIDPTFDGRPGVDAPFTGPEGIEIGTPLSTLRETFTTDAWDAADVFEGSFEIFAGDTTGAAFRLDADERVDRMSAGYTCGLGR